jgi:exopolysaccharide biosynthesis protein
MKLIMKLTHKYTFSLIPAMLLLITFASCQKNSTAPSKAPVHYSALTQRLADSTHVMAAVFSDTAFAVTEGVTETDIHYLNMEGATTRMFILSVDLTNPHVSLQVATPYDASGTALQTVPDMAKYIDGPGHYVMAGVNGDFFNISTGQIMGVEYKNGVALKAAFTDNSQKPQQGLTFFAVLSDGTPYIGEKGADYDSMRASIVNATGGGVVLVRNHKPVPQTIPTVDPRTAVGYDDKGTVYFIVVDGRDFFYSNGIDYEQMASCMAALGVRKAINLDGGGSSILMIRSPLADVWQVRNHPSDGAPRAIVNAWMVVSDKE